MEPVTNKLIISKDNQLIQASYELSLSEQRVLLLCIAKLDSRAAKPDNYEFIVSASDLANDLGITRENAYRDLKIAVNRLFSRTIIIKDDGDCEGRERHWLEEKAFFKSSGVAVLY